METCKGSNRSWHKLVIQFPVLLEIDYITKKTLLAAVFLVSKREFEKKVDRVAKSFAFLCLPTYKITLYNKKYLVKNASHASVLGCNICPSVLKSPSPAAIAGKGVIRSRASCLSASNFPSQIDESTSSTTSKCQWVISWGFSFLSWRTYLHRLRLTD